MKYIIFLLITSFFSLSAQAARVQITANDVDDRIDVYIDGDHKDSCEWQSNPGCYVGLQGNLSGTHDIRFKLTNYVYRGPCLFGGCGKYAADLQIKSDGDVIWSKSIYRSDNSSGIKYNETIRCNFNTGSCWEK